MKKFLIASTALVAAGLMSGTASASDKISLQLGGFSKWWVVGQWQQSAYEKAALVAPTNVDVKGDNEVYFGGSTTLDNGIQVGIDVQLEAGGAADMTTDTIDESYVWVAGGFGKAIIGTKNNGTYLLHVSAPDAAGNFNEAGIVTGGNAIAQPGAVTGPAGGLTTAIATDNDAEKITYVAPTFYGLTVGGSYVPSALNQDVRGVPAAGGKDVAAYGVGALYANTFGPVGVKLSGGWVTYDEGAAGAFSNEYSTGAQISFSGVTVGGSFRDTGINNNNHGTPTGISALAGNEGRVWDAGIQYASGPYAVSFAYVSSSMEGAVGGGNDKISIYQASGKYSLGAGVDVLGSVAHAKYTDEAGLGGATENKGWTAMTGLSLAF